MDIQTLIFIILVTVSTSIFYQDLMKNGHILENWKLFLNTLPLYISKPLGLCVICSTVWIGVIVSLIINPIFIFPTIILSHQIIKYLYNES